GSFEEFENLNIFEAGDENAALLAVSVMMQAETDDTGLAKRMEKFADSFAETGKWKDSDTKTAISEWAIEATANGMLDSIRKNVEAWNDGDKVAAFEKFIEAYADGDSVVLSSSSKSPESAEGSSSSFSQDTTYNAEKNTLTDARDGKVYKTVKIGSQVWMAENLNYATEKSYCYNDSSKYCDKYGRLYTWAAAMDACPTGWHLPGEEEWNILLSEVGGQSIAGTALKSRSGWHDGGNGTDAFGFSALPAGRRDTVGEFTCDGEYTDFWTTAEGGDDFAYFMFLYYYNEYMPLGGDSKNFALSVRCLKDASPAIVSGSSSSSGVTPKSSSSVEVQPNSSETESSSSSGEDKMNCLVLLEGETDWNWNVPKECRFNPDIDYGTMIDTRDNKQYKTVKIGDQVWMAENLNFDPGQGGSGDAKYDWSWCHNNKAEHCDVAGRFYTWAAAIDSVKLATDADNSLDCGYGKECGLDSVGSATLIQGICPDGWHLPNNGEWNSLFTAVGGSGKAGTLLKSQTGWYGNGNGTDAFGFTALSVGRSYSHASFDFDGLYAYFWSATENDSNYAYGMYLYYRGDDVGAGLYDSYKNYGFSVRCVKD
ncbi:MAG: fibrobacter succinogenes major paralogous domain-containing protein, partial [Fibrobacter sp.]|nr:fibrobacter succinogenes major paralogous domain-containing protein [Fibrobacter sp.]